MHFKFRLLLFVPILALLITNQTVLAQDKQPSPNSPWGEIVDENGNIRFDNLIDLGETQVQTNWMPDIPFIDGEATYHRYLTPSGNVVVLPSASTLFFMALNPQESGFSQSDSTLGNGIGALETMLAGYLTPADLQQMGYTNSDQFFKDVIDGRTSIWSFGGQHMLNFMMDLLSGSLADQNLYTMLLLYTKGNCDAVPGGCPSSATVTAPTPVPSVCQAPFIQTSPIEVTGGSSEGGKIAPPKPVVIGQDPERRGVDVQVKVLIPPVVYHFFEAIRHEAQVCAQDSAGLGSGCADHPGDPQWTTTVHTWYECREHVQVFPDYLASARVAVDLTPSSRNWILTDLAQAYPGAHLLHPDFSYAFPGPGSLQGDQSISWTKIIPSIQTADPGDYTTTVTIRTAGTLVSAPRQVQVGIGQLTVALVRVSLIEQP